MKRVLVAILLSILIFSIIPVFAQEIDLSVLSFEALSELKKQVEYEYSTRPEAEPLILGLMKLG